MVARFVKVVGQTLGQWVKPKTKRMTWPLHWLSLTPFPCWLVKWKSNLARVLFSWTAPAQRVGGAEGVPESSAPYRSNSFARVSSFSRHFQGAFLAWRVPRVETLG